MERIKIHLKKIKPYHILSVLVAGGIAFVAMDFSNLPLFNNLDNFIIFASEELKIEKEVQISSGDLGSNGKINIEKDDIINGNLFADEIIIDKNTVINGNVSFNKLKTEKETQILGTQTKPVSIPIANLPEIPDFQIGTQDFKFEGQSNALTAGNYRDLIVEKNSRLVLNGAVYNIRKLELKENSTLIFNAQTTLNIQFKLKGQQHIAILPGDNSLKPTDLAINYIGLRTKAEKEVKEDDDEEINALHNEKENKDSKAGKIGRPIVFGKESFLNFKLLAPKAGVHIGETSTMRGQVLARKIKIEKGSVLSREPTIIKTSRPEDIITDSGGGVYPINEILVSLIATASIADAQNIAQSIGGQIVSIILPDLYKIEIQTRTIKELEDKLNLLINSSNPLIKGVFRNFVMLESAGYPFDNFTSLSKADQTLNEVLPAVFSNLKQTLVIILLFLLTAFIIYLKKDSLTRILKIIYSKLFYDKKHFKLFIILSALSIIIPTHTIGLLAWLFFDLTLSSLREVIAAFFSITTYARTFGIPFETLGFDSGFVGYNQGVFDSGYSVSFLGYSVFGFAGNIIFFYAILFLIKYVKNNFQYRLKSIPVAFAVLFLLLFGTYVGLVRYFREVRTFIPMPIINRIEYLISHVNAQEAVKYDLQNLKNRNANLTQAYDKIRIFDAWDRINNSTNLPLSPVTVGIVDTGADRSHQEFNDPKVNLGVLGDTLSDLRKPRGHGTQVAGIIGANNISRTTDLPIDSLQMNGILSGILSEDKYKLEIRPSGSFTTSATSTFEDVFVALKKVAASDAQIINMSFVLERCTDLSFLMRNFIVEKCAKTNKEWSGADAEFQGVFNSNSGKLFVAAAGNEDANFVFATPAHWSIIIENVISVGATNLNDNRATFPSILEKSNFGIELNISAPGIGVYAPKPGGGYDPNFSGTSASAPMVTGVAGLIKAIKPELTPAQIKNILIKTENTDPVITEPDKPIGRRLNAFKAVCDPLVGLDCAPTPPPQLPIWPMFQKNAQRTGLADVAGPPFATSSAVTLKWQKDLGIASNFPPLVGAQAVYVSAGGGLRNLLAFDKTNGNQIWQANIPAGAVNGALGPDGTIYVCGLNTNQQSILTAISPADGAIKWQFVVGLSRPCNSPAVAQNGIIYTTVPPPFNSQTAVVVAVNPDGTEKWRHEEGNTATTPPALSNDESQVYVGFRESLKAFNTQSGQILWSQDSFFFIFTFVVVDSGDRVLALNISNDSITAFSKTGNFLWQSGGVSAMSLYPGNKIFATNPGGFKFFNASDGSLISFGSWPDGFQLTGAFPIVDKNGIIYIPLAIFGNPSQVKLFAFEDSGAIRWTFDIPSNLNIAAIGGSALNSDGTLYLLAQGLLFAF